jgi:hypothetical protein
MANSPRISNETANAEADATTALAATGYLRIYDGTQPATADTAITTQVLLAELRFGSPAFGAASAGVSTANAVTGDASANATGTAAWFRALKSNGTSPIYDGSVGTSGADLNLGSVAIQAGAAVDVTGFTYTRPKS